MLLKLRQLRALGLIAVASFAIVMSSCRMSEITKNCDGDEECHRNAKICHNPTMHALACDLDHLEAHIDKYGSVVAMQPSVWGQARLTKYRDEFEKEMSKDLAKFNVTLQGSVSRSDQAYLASATAISAAISGSKAYYAPTPSVAVQNNTTALTPIAVPDATVDTGVFKGFDSISRTPVRAPVSLGFPSFAAAGVSLEPTIVLSQKERYLNHLNQIRRNNEGDDTADSPGYSLNLVRIPVSVLPGKHTLKGYGAEITMTLTPHIGDELLPTTFRQLVINDLTEQLSLPLTKVMEDQDNVAIIREVLEILDKCYYEELDACRRKLVIRTAAQPKEQKEKTWLDCYRAHPHEITEAFLATRHNAEVDRRATELIGKLEECASKLDPCATPPKVQKAGGGSEPPRKTPRQIQQAQRVASIIAPASTGGSTGGIKKSLACLKKGQMDAFDDAYSSSTQRVSPFAIPLSQMFDVYGVHTLAHVVDEINDAVKNHTSAGGKLYYGEVKSVLRDELEAAYRLLSLEVNRDLWEKHCTPELVNAIRSRHQGTIDRLLNDFFDDLNCRKPSLTHSGTDGLAWVIIVEAALLNERLKKDIVDASAAKNGPSTSADHLRFFMPRPDTHEIQAFREYVETRWPIHVFAIDPITQDQNLADTYSRRQEMQLSLSLAFASGNISARNMSRYARRIEEDMETIAINKTQVGFSHGSDTFGWRFYPRFQTPEFESNAKSLFRDQLIGGPSKNEEIKQMRLEPGMRECVAIVMMPSFVPYVKCESSSNWFKLTNPKHKEFTLTDAVRLGKIVKSVQTCSPNIRNENCYRDGDLSRLMAKLKQLENRLPLQDTMVQVPYENTLGGFEMFNTGITDLAPQLRGWYGGPGVLDKADTQLFLVGDHFSVHHTIVTAGGKDVTFELISRQIMKVTIPKGTTPNSRKEGSDKPKDDKPQPDFKYVDVHVATPYGVTAHLEIPFYEVPSPTDSKTGLDWNPSTVEVGYAFEGNAIKPLAGVQSWPPLAIKWDVKLLKDPPASTATQPLSFDLDLTFASPYSDASGKAAKTFPAQTIRLSGLSFTVDGKTKEIQVNSAALVNGLFNGAPASGAYSGAPGFGGYFNKGTPPVPIATTKVVMTIKGSDGKPLPGTTPIAVGSGLTVIWSPAPGSGSAQPILVHPGGGPVLFSAPCPPVLLPQHAPAKNEFTWIPPTPKATVTIKDSAVTEFKFEPVQDLTVVDKTARAKEFPLKSAKLKLKFTVFNDKGEAKWTLETESINLDFKDGKSAPLASKSLADAFKTSLQNATKGLKLKAEDIAKLDADGFVGASDGTGVTIAMLPHFSFAVTTTEVKAAIRAPDQPAIVGPSFGRPRPALINDSLPRSDTIAQRRDR